MGTTTLNTGIKPENDHEMDLQVIFLEPLGTKNCTEYQLLPS